MSGQSPHVYEEGITNASRTIYQSSAPDGEMLHFPQGRIYQFRHGLGVAPVSVDVFLSFKPQLTEGGDTTSNTRPNNLAPSAGNQAVIEVWNDEIIQVRNDTCENNFHLRIVAFADPDDADHDGADPGDADTDSGPGMGGAAGAEGTAGIE